MILRIKFYRFALRLVTYLLPLVAHAISVRIWLAAWTLADRTAIYVPSAHLPAILSISLIWALVAEVYKVTSVDELFRERTGLRAALSACSAAGAVTVVALFFSRDVVFPRGLLIFYFVILLVLVLMVRAVFRSYVRVRLGERPVKILVIGADSFAKRAALRLEKLPLASCQVVGHVVLPGQESSVENLPSYSLDNLGEIGPEQGINEAVIAVQPGEFSRIPRILHALEKLSIPIRAIVDLGEGIVVRERLFQLGRMQMLDLTTTPAESLDYALLKRIFDIVFASFVLLMASPVLVLIALVVKVTSRGPILFVQQRVGLNGRLFQMYKFRTMRLGSKSESDFLWTTQSDSRCTAFGSILRRTSLDELPQFVNVIKGDMSVVGPRPERPHFVRKFLTDVSRYNNRHWLKVGITGWAQVNGWRGDTSIQKRLEFDLYYLQNWSFSFDLRIIAMTILSGLIHRNAY